jgi:hypothetical protein
MQILLLQTVARHEGKPGIRVPQSGWLHRPRLGSPSHDEGLGPVNSTFRRSHRWQRVLRSDDATEFAREDHLHTVLFSTYPDDVGLYGKPMARNAQIWSNAFHAVLHGPTADRNSIHRAIEVMEAGSSFGYRFFYPPMQAGRFTVFWHRPLMAFRDLRTGQPAIIDNTLTGYFTAMDTARPTELLELWPRFGPEKGSTGNTLHRAPPSSSMGNTRQIFADALGVDLDTDVAVSDALTFAQTANRAFETRYWETIATLAEGRYRNKNSGDCIKDAITQGQLPHPGRDLEALGDYLLDHYSIAAQEAGLTEQIVIGDAPFRWKTDFEYPWMGGWSDNQEGRKHERNLIVVIPGKNRNEAIIMADHYDTAYMEDVYGYRPEPISDGARLAARGADDNHSATAALMLGAASFMELSRAGLLDRDIWLVHLTGEEFPSDCLGARDLAQRFVEQTMRMHTRDGVELDLSKTRVCGLYVLDMIAHNNDRHPDIFQIAPGNSRDSLWLAYQAHMATRLWQSGVALWNLTPSRRNLGRGKRSGDGSSIPLTARHLAPHGDVRMHNNPRSTLFNTDGQIFSDAGVPTVLFMENYDINRKGYHDSEDTMANIDLDYGSAVASIAIETVARAAVQPIKV